jgi:AbiV family abortive infection protein
MASLSKFEELAGMAFENALRLHVDSIRAFEEESFATAYQLSITASEEIGKALLLEEYVWQVSIHQWNEKDEFAQKYLQSIFSSHKAKQRKFAYFANDFLRRNSFKNASSLINPLTKGIGETEKQNSTFVGLTRLKNGKVNLNGKIVTPRLFAQPDKAEKQITLNSDFLVVYISGFIRGIYGTDSYSIAQHMSQDNLDILEALWLKHGLLAKHILALHQKHSVLKNPLADWE